MIELNGYVNSSIGNITSISAGTPQVYYDGLTIHCDIQEILYSTA